MDKPLGIRSFLFIIISLFFLCLDPIIFASSPLPCVSFTTETGVWSPSFILKNNCGESLEMRDSLIQFDTNQNLSGTFWGDFGSLTSPTPTSYSSEPKGDGTYLTTMPLTFPQPKDWTPNTKLPAGKSIKIIFSASPKTTIQNLKFYPLSPIPGKKGEIILNLPNNPTEQTGIAPDIEVSENDGTYHVRIKDAAWGKPYPLKSIPYGTYTVTVHPLETSGKVWTGSTIPPSPITVNDSKPVTIEIQYAQPVETGNIRIQLNQEIPEANLAAPTVHMKDLTTGQTLPDVSVNWNSSSTVSALAAGHQFLLTADQLAGQWHLYNGIFSNGNPITVKANSTHLASLTFTALPAVTTEVNASINNIPSKKTATLTAIDNFNYHYSREITNGDMLLWKLPVNRQYQLSATPVEDQGKIFAAHIDPAQFLTKENVPQPIKISYSSQTSASFSPYVDVTLGSIAKWDNTTESMQPLGLLDIEKNAGIKAFHLAFITADNGCKGTWAGYPVSSAANGFGVPVFKKLKDDGASLTVALGGLNGQYLAQACTTLPQLQAAYENIIQIYQPDALDFDVENDMQTNNTQLDRMMQAIKAIQNKYPSLKISFTLPVMPSGLIPSMGLNVLKRAKENGLTQYGVNIMAMDYGPSFTEKSMSQYAIDAATNTFQQLKELYPDQSDETLWHRIEVTPMIGLNDTLPLNFSLQDAQTLKQFAKEKNLGMLSFCSLTRDHPCNVTYVSNTCSSQNPAIGQPNQTVDYEYSLLFMGSNSKLNPAKIKPVP
ncbi:chitinase [Coxiella burnetii]|uniref:chitinase n=2 Tax=Coxiella burnetii TaxID=777 RepID=UPI000315C2C5|nr:chitinase [Coxiella burnetii]